MSRTNLYIILLVLCVQSAPIMFWPNGDIPYSFSDTTNKKYTLARTNVLKVIKLFTSKTCLTFTVSGTGLAPRVVFDVTKSTCAPEINGYRDKPDIVFGASSDCTRGDLVEGFQLILGMVPEHTRPDRNMFIQFNSAAVSNSNRFQ
eukprot:PhF_6_TR7255/c0_g1_i1/m.10828